ncbi:insert subdomain of RNA polymerase alpha subunit [Ganoderma leucocontextum]|nr:insert subdomain of RNA polymerase alpha subunit [Ganoderma leucocontextum]
MTRMVVDVENGRCESSARYSRAPSVFNPRHRVGVHRAHVSDISNTEFPGHHLNEDHSWSLAKFKVVRPRRTLTNLRVSGKRLSQRSVEFDLVGVDGWIANVFRRILIAEVPTIAIEDVYVFNNTPLIYDEILSHRLGLIRGTSTPGCSSSEHRANSTRTGTLSDSMRAWKKPPEDTPQIIHDVVTTGDLVCEPQGEQVTVFAANPPAATNKDIVLTKLAPEHIIEIETHAGKGLGKEHAKWSAATASYRPHPLVVLNPSKPVPRENAEKFARCFSLVVVRVWAHTAKSRSASATSANASVTGSSVMRSKIASIRAAAEALLADSEDLGSGAVVGGPDVDGDVEMNGE